MIAFSEPKDTFGLHCYRCLQHGQLRPLQVLLITGTVLSNDINYSTFKYARKKKKRKKKKKDNNGVCYHNVKICLELKTIPLGYAFIKCHLLILKYNWKKCKHFHGTNFQEKAKSLSKFYG